ncbi:olfactory receptor class A-like protein 1 [Sphaerodactylus townsendi]|uniref:olfactory receptor class A-like protein 1 n=1 Tax=Sphaerodactylus townsendi TaxID=933632 RepID=UPI002026E4B4|nr:olfactory receptor class A-like protein 1 [Sphaerodactylus townsendi]
MIGIPGNLAILYAFICAVCQQNLTPSEIILGKLALANLLVILTRGVPLTLRTLGVHTMYDSLSCGITLYIYCVSRAMSIFLTSMLGCFQCLVIVPCPPRCLRLGRTFLERLPSVMISLWCFNLLVCCTRLLYSMPRTDTNCTKEEITVIYDFCCVVFPSHFLYFGNGVIFVTRDMFFLGIMTVSSGYLLLVFQKHGEMVKCLPMLQIKQTELHAAKSVVGLLVMYLLSFGLDSIFWMVNLCVSPVSLQFADARMFFDSCYSAISPVLIILTNKKIQARLKCAIGNFVLLTRNHTSKNIQGQTNGKICNS